MAAATGFHDVDHDGEILGADLSEDAVSSHLSRLEAKRKPKRRYCPRRAKEIMDDIQGGDSSMRQQSTFEEMRRVTYATRDHAEGDHATVAEVVSSSGVTTAACNFSSSAVWLTFRGEWQNPRTRHQCCWAPKAPVTAARLPTC